MRLLKRIKKAQTSSVYRIITFSPLIISLGLNNLPINNVQAEEISHRNLKEEYKPIFKYDNGDEISIFFKENKLFIKKSNNTDIWNNEVEIRENFHFYNIEVVENSGFIIINNYCEDKSHNNSSTNDKHQCSNETEAYNLLAFNHQGELLLNEYATDLSDEYLNKFINDIFSVHSEQFTTELDSLSQEDLYSKVLELLSIAEKTLNELDIDKAYLAILKISDDKAREDLIQRLNIISKESIEMEIQNPSNEELIINDNTTLSTSSEITLSVDTNNLTFDHLNVSEDTVLNRAIVLNVTSSLAYDINVYIEGNVVSNTNTTNLKKDVFSIKESNSSNFLTFGDNGKVTIVSNSPAGTLKTHYVDIKLNTSKNVIRDIYKAAFKVEAVTR